MNCGWKNENLKNRCIAFIQKKIIKNLVRKLDPPVVHTSIPVYQERLETLNIDALPLPIFSNIPMNDNIHNKNFENFVITFFSQLTLRDSVRDFLKTLVQELKKKGMRYEILILGGDKRSKLDLKASLKTIPDISDKIKLIGFLQDKELSSVIRNSNLGITPVPRHLLGKSGSVATFLSHGIPVAAPYIKFHNYSENCGFFTATINKAIVHQPNLVEINRASLVAKDIAETLKAASVVQTFKNDLELIVSIKEIHWNMLI